MKSTAQADPKNIIPIIEKIVLAGSDELRQKVEYDFHESDSEDIRKALVRWLSAPEWQLRHMAVLALTFGTDIDNLDTDTCRKLADDPKPAIRRVLASNLPLRYRNSIPGEERQRIIRRVANHPDPFIQFQAISIKLNGTSQVEGRR